MGTSHTVIIFEGIAVVDVDGIAHDTYMSIRTEAIGYTIRWFGSFEWMSDAPKGLFHGKFLDVVLSDGRECKIQVPHPSIDSGGNGPRLEFLGVSLPPGFQWFPHEDTMTTELVVSHTSGRVWYARLFATLALPLVVASIWWDGHRWEALGTGLLFSVVSVHLSPARPRKMKEAGNDGPPLDCPHA